MLLNLLANAVNYNTPGGRVTVTWSQTIVVLLDVHLPDGSGLDALKGLKSQPRAKAIAVIVLTADATTASRRRADDYGAEDFLSKPLDVELLLDALERIPSSTERDAGGMRV